DDLRKQVTSLRGKIDARLTLIDAHGRVLADSQEDPAVMDNHASRPEVQAARQDGFGVSTRHSDTVELDMMYAALRTESAGQPVPLCRAALPLDRIHAELATLRGIIWTTAALTALASVLLAFLLARRITRPLQELTTGAERLAAGGYGHKVHVAG